MNIDSGMREKSLVERAKAIILKPKEEWPVISAETTPQSAILTGYILPLAAIGPVAHLIGGQVFGYGALFVHWRPSLTGGIASAVLTFVMSLVMVYVLTWIADFLAPRFQGTSNKAAAFKLVAYSMTAGWVAGIFGLIPQLGVLGLVGLYSIYLFYLGAPVMMKIPADQSVAYTAITAVCTLVLGLIVNLVVGAVVGLFFATSMLGSGMGSHMSSGGSTSVTIPGVGTIDSDKVSAMGKQMEDAANGKTQPVAADSLKALLPSAIGGYTRTAVETQGVGSMGTSADGTYTSGDKSFKLTISDLHGIGALAGLGAAMGVEESKEDANGYEKTGTVNGQMQTESWNNSDSSGKFGHMIDNRFMVTAEGQAGSIDDLKNAVAAVDEGSLTQLAS